MAGPLIDGSTDPDSEFSAYVAANADRVRFMAYLLCGDWQEAEDLAQTTFIKLYRAWSRIDRSEPIDAYVRTTVTRTYLNERRRLWRKLERLTGTLPEPAAPDPAGPEQRMLVWAALARVPRKQRAALVLRYWEDLSLAETAAVLGCSEGNVKSQCSRGLQTLREVIAGMADLPVPEGGART